MGVDFRNVVFKKRRARAGGLEDLLRLARRRVYDKIRRGDVEARLRQRFATSPPDAAPSPRHQREWARRAHAASSVERTCSAARSASAATVSEGLTPAEVGKTLASTTNRLE